MRISNFIYIAFLFSLAFSGCISNSDSSITEYVALIPKPQQVEFKDGAFKIEQEAGIYFSEEFSNAGEFLMDYLHKGAGTILVLTNHENAQIAFFKDDSLPSEGYELRISESTLEVTAADASGAFYAVQTIRQLLPLKLENGSFSDKEALLVPQLFISDAPAYRYRGMHLDVGRHFFPKKFIKKYISHLASLKMNYFHWHLTEDQGWRIEIKKYPLLTSHGAYRDETLIGHYSDTPQKFDDVKYGGYYTQDDIREIVAFASRHQVTIIPEIEMPGHAQAAISAYPELGCTNEPVPVATKWGVFENIYCPNQRTFDFLKDVLSEVISLFPGEYIHIGGDEAPKVQWKKCEHCQSLISDLQLKDEAGLQSYFIKEIESFLNSKGKKIIGWDEILEGGLAPNATVMSWRGITGGIDAAKAGHDVIMTPTSHAYFDYYQDDHPEEPLAIGGYLPLKKVYSFNPTPEELSTDEADFVIGAQGNIWTEYMKTESHVEYMAFPRMFAMSEVVWTGPNDDGDDSYLEFIKRVELFNDRLSARGVNFANHLNKLSGKIISNNDSVYYLLSTPLPDKEIRYSINSEDEIIYVQPIPIFENTNLSAYVYDGERKLGRTFVQEIIFHKGVTSTISLNVEPNAAYSEGGKKALINGIKGSDSRYGDKEWLGFWGDDLEVVIDLGKETVVNKISTRFYNAKGQWIYAPENIEILFDKGNPISMKLPVENPEDNLVNFILEVENISTQFVTLKISNFGLIPEGKQGAGHKAWTFIDEITIE